MKLKLLLACMACASWAPSYSRELPAPGQDYYSLQIASGKDVKALELLSARYSALPFVRIESRGALYVLRAGFWESKQSARLAVPQEFAGAGYIRTATFRPEAMVRSHWNADPLLGPATVAAPPKAPEPVVSLPPPLAGPLPVAPLRKASQAEPAFDVLQPFNAADFALAYDVLLGGGDSARAFLVAQRAVRELPNDRAWRKKLAQVAEWTQRPVLATQQWSYLFQQGDHSDETVSMVIRLAFFLDNPEIALQAWQVRAQHGALTDAQWAGVFQLYESTAQPSEGSRYFEAQFQQKRMPHLLEYAARMAENAGEDARAQTLYLQRAQLEPFSLDMVLRGVVSLIRGNQLEDALGVMRTYEAKVPEEATEFWNLLGQVAWELRDYGSAQRGYQRYVKTPQATVTDWSRLINLVRPQYPAQAADLALQAYRRFGAVDQLVLALEIYVEIKDTPALTRILSSLDAEALKKAEQEKRFLLIRAQFNQGQKKTDLAWADLHRALQQFPQETDVVLASLWFLIDTGRSDELAPLLQRYASRASMDSAYWLAYAAANQQLDRHRESATWYAKEIRRKSDDPLVLLNYADALERSQREGMADRIRRHAWLTLKRQYPQPVALPKQGAQPELLALMRLAITNHPGDPGLRLVRQLAQQMRSESLPPSDDGQTRALVLGWAIAQEQYANARSWMWLRYARQSQIAPPLWGEAQVALQLGETQTLDRLLAQNPAEIPIYDRYDTAYALGHVPQALDISFKGMDAQDDDEPLHDRFRQHAPEHANYVQLRAVTENLGTLGQQSLPLGEVMRAGVEWEARWVVNPGLRMTFGWSHLGLSVDDTNVGVSLPSSDRLDHIAAQWLGARGESTNLELLRRNEAQQFFGMRLGQTLRWGERLNVDAGLDYRVDSAVSLPLQLYGYENALHTSVNYTLGKREYVRIAPRLAQYYTQGNDYLGSGQILDLEAGYRIRTEYPDWRVRVFSTHQHFIYGGSVVADTAALYIPAGGSTAGVCLGMGENLAGQNLQTGYSRAWRPFVDLCMNRNTAGDEGYTGFLGIAGSVTGEDHLSVLWQNSGGYVAGSTATKSLAIRYRYYF